MRFFHIFPQYFIDKHFYFFNTYEVVRIISNKIERVKQVMRVIYTIYKNFIKTIINPRQTKTPNINKLTRQLWVISLLNMVFLEDLQ
ncbi:hypothetical protein A6V27_13255 [Hafnia alvei]|nr:hypothetical protein A6V27_13255 [Hafnia alvei]